MTSSPLINQANYSVIAVVVVYNDYQSLIALIKTLLGQIDALVIIDNSDENCEITDAVLNEPKVIYQRSGSNKGLAAGLNDGLRLSKKFNPDWLLLLDQDSVVSENMIDCMLNEYLQNPNMAKIAMLCPDVFLSDKKSHQYPLFFGLFKVKNVTATSDKVDFCITSGSMIKASLFDEVGYMQESFFIDYIDFDFCLRLRSFGYKILFISEAVLTHKLGESRINKIGIRYTFHSPQRIYFQTRNRLIVVRRYGMRFPSFAIMQLSLFMLKFFKILLIEDRKIKRLRCYFTGFLDSFRKQFSSS